MPVFPDLDHYTWFEAHTETIIAKCKRTAISVPGVTDQPFVFYVPGGDDKYPSFWIRDAGMQCRSGFISRETMETMLQVILWFQNGPRQRNLAHGLRVDPWSIPDHINLPGVGSPEMLKKNGVGAVFFPGTYSTSDDQGTGGYGVRPADDDIYEVVELAYLISQWMIPSQRRAWLAGNINGVAIIERLHLGMRHMTVEPEFGLCFNGSDDWAAASFHDALRPRGCVTLTSALRFRAAQRMRRMATALGKKDFACQYEDMARRIAEGLQNRMQMPDGWLMIGSDTYRQPDLWGTAQALYHGALNGESAQAARSALLKAVMDGSITSAGGYLRHTPLWADIVPGKSTWSDEINPFGVYQSGGYWPQMIGHVAWCIAPLNMDSARQLACKFIDHTRDRAEHGAPFEWLNPAIPKEDGRWYSPSATLPLEAFRRLSSCD
ncbi:MAG: hypothetical protein KJ964_08705 [Verrucomicrobia bacterium]|nr:hypothetical protein [Verrucomicrobiota bacterium]MBU1735061.1 hypothetical protein [Verrucomicrobiota bacterium]MBU1856579.1 hypothetical protein [Verrucomicrobiota bacterium]